MMNHHRLRRPHHHQFIAYVCVNSKNWLSVNAILFRFIILHSLNSIILVIVAITVGTF